MFFDLITTFDQIESSLKLDCLYSNGHFFLRACTTCSELPLNKIAMVCVRIRHPKIVECRYNNAK